MLPATFSILGISPTTALDTPKPTKFLHESHLHSLTRANTHQARAGLTQRFANVARPNNRARGQPS